MNDFAGQIGNILVNSKLTGCLVFDGDGNIHFANRAISDYLNMSQELIMGSSLKDLLPFSEYEYALSSIESFLKTGDFRELLWTITDQSGTPYKFKIEPFRISSNGNEMVCVLVHDGKEIALKERLIDSTHRLKYLAHQQDLAIRTAKLGVWQLDIKTGNTTWNDEMLRMYDMSREQFDKDQYHWQKLIHPEDADFIEGKMTALAQGKTVNDIEFRIVTGNNELRHIQASGSPVFNDKGEVVEVTGVNIDITHLKEAQKQILDNQKQLKESLKEKEILLTEIHHRVKNNLAIVSGLLDLQIFKQQEEQHKIILRDARNRIQSIAMVHEQLYKEMEFSSINLATYYPKLFQNLQDNLITKDDRIEFDLKFDLPDLNINRAVPMGLLITELFINSVKYAMNEQVLNVKFHLTEADNMIQAVYEDNGPGFDKNIIKQNQTLGWEIIETILEQLEADYTLDTNDKFKLGFTFTESLRGSHSVHTKVLEQTKPYKA